MTTEVKLPELGENVAEGTVVSVLVSEGDRIARNDSIIEIETDKATIEVPSTAAGVVKKIVVKAGQAAKVGQVLIVLEGDGAGDAGDAKAATPKGDAGAKKSAPSAAPAAKQAAPAAAPPPAPARASAAPAPASQPQSEAAAPAAPEPASARPPGKVPASPTVRRLAYEIGVDVTAIPGSGTGGRVSLEDVKRYSKQLHESRASGAGAGTPAVKSLPDFAKWGEIDVQPMSNIRLKTAENMGHAWSVVAQVTQFDKADISHVESFRQKYKQRVEAAGGKLTVTAILVKVAAAALRRFPKFNSSVDMRNHTVVMKKYVHIGVAVDTDFGLLVPVIRDVDRKSITEIAVELAALSEKARSKKLGLDEMHGGSFTITNLGGIGGTGFTPIVNWPEVAILGVARGAHEPVYVDGAFVPRLVMPIALSYDHRVIDGADGVRFARFICEALEDPLVLALEG